VDIVKEGQTILTRDLDIENGQAELTLAATPGLRERWTSTLICLGEMRVQWGSPLVFVQPADELRSRLRRTRPTRAAKSAQLRGDLSAC